MESSLDEALKLKEDQAMILDLGPYHEDRLAAAVDMATELANLDFRYRDIGRLLDEWQARLGQSQVS